VIRTQRIAILIPWDDGKLIDLHTHTVGGKLTSANAINNAGEIVGAAAFLVPQAMLTFGKMV
jgi:hypothetical protein